MDSRKCEVDCAVEPGFEPPFEILRPDSIDSLLKIRDTDRSPVPNYPGFTSTAFRSPGNPSSPILLLYQIYEETLLDRLDNVKALQIEFVLARHCVSKIPDPMDPDPARYAILAALAKDLAEYINSLINEERGTSAANIKMYNMQQVREKRGEYNYEMFSLMTGKQPSPWAAERTPAWATQVKVLQKRLIIYDIYGNFPDDRGPARRNFLEKGIYLAQYPRAGPACDQRRATTGFKPVGLYTCPRSFELLINTRSSRHRNPDPYTRDFAREEVPLGSLYCMYEVLGRGEDTIMFYMESFYKQVTWRLEEIPDPQDPDPVRYAILAGIVKHMVWAFNQPIVERNYQIRGQKTPIPMLKGLESIREPYTTWRRANGLERAPRWVTTIPHPEDPVVIPNRDGKIARRNVDASPEFLSVNVLAFRPTP